MFYILDMDFAIEVIQRRHEMDSLNSCLQLGSLEADFVVAYQIGGGGVSFRDRMAFIQLVKRE